MQSSNAPDKNSTIVLVGTGMHKPNQRALVSALEHRDIPTEALEHQWYIHSLINYCWPRNAYFFYNGKHIQYIDYNMPIQGGQAHAGNDFLIVSDGVYKKPKTWLSKETNQKELKEYAQRAFGARVHIVDCDMGESTRIGGHIDYFSMLLPKRRIFVVDTYTGSRYVGSPSYRNAAEAEGFEYVEFEDRECNFPLNCLVLPQNGDDVVFYDARARKLGEFFDEKGVDSVAVELPYDNAHGKIQCCTNIKNADAKTSNLL